VINLLDLDIDGLARLFAEMGEKPFRARQVSRWLHQRFVDDIAAMTDLARPLRERLAGVAEIRGPAVIRDTTASDGTRKWLLDVGQGNDAAHGVGVDDEVLAPLLGGFKVQPSR